MKSQNWIQNHAPENLERLGENPYSGRFIIIGVNSTEHYYVQVCAITGHDDATRNFFFEKEDDRLLALPADPNKTKNPGKISSVAYNAMARSGHTHILGNGNQTDVVKNTLDRTQSTMPSLEYVLDNQQYETDAPDYTPCITGISFGSSYGELQIIRKSPYSDTSIRSSYTYGPHNKLVPGYGFFMSTYWGIGSPLPSFATAPICMPLRGNIERIAETFWNILDRKSRVSLAVKFIDRKTFDSEIYVINNFGKRR